MQPTQDLTKGVDPTAHAHMPTIEIHVNHKPVNLVGHEHTGLEIKEAAIAQGVKIKTDFLLFLVHHHKPNDPIGDEETIKVNHHSHFHSIDNDDNS